MEHKSLLESYTTWAAVPTDPKKIKYNIHILSSVLNSIFSAKTFNLKKPIRRLYSVYSFLINNFPRWLKNYTKQRNDKAHKNTN